MRASRERELAFTSYLRLGAMAAVVGVHTLASIVSNDAIRGSATWWVATALDLGSSWCVPLFIMVSGTLLLEPDGLGAGAFYRRRLRRIAIPLVVAHVGYFALRAVGGEHLTPSIIVHDLLHATVYTQLYFFWIILGLYLVTPLLRRVIGGDPRVALATGAAALAWMVAVSSGAAMLHAIGQPVAIWQPAALTLWVPYLGYFVLGYALRSWVAGPGALAAAVASFLLADALVVWHYTVGLRFAIADVLLGGGYQGLPVAVSAVALFVIEFVADKDTRAPFPRAARFAERFAQAALDAGLVIWPNVGQADGVDGDIAMLAPPFVITDEQVDELVSLFGQAVRTVTEGVEAST